MPPPDLRRPIEAHHISQTGTKMAKHTEIFTQEMLNAMSCRRRYEIEHVKNFRLRDSNRWYPPRLKELLMELLFARDWAIADGRTEDSIELVIQRMKDRWWNEILGKHSPNEKALSEMFSIVDEAMSIIAYYSESQRIDLIHRYAHKNKKPIVRILAENRLPSFEKKKMGGSSKYSFASLIDKIIIEDGKYKLFFYYLTSTPDREEVSSELERRLDIWGTVWNAQRLIGRRIDSIVFDVVRTKPPAQPMLLKCRKCKGGGEIIKDVQGEKVLEDCPKCGGDGVDAVSTKRCDTTGDIWVKTYHKYRGRDTTEHYKAAAEKIISELYDRGETFSYRLEFPVIDEMIERWLCDTYENIREIKHAEKRNTFPKNPSQCGVSFNSCPYRSICSGATSRKSHDVFFKLCTDKYPGIHLWSK